MARADLIGYQKCPECGLDGAEIRPDKSGAPYRFCPDCTAQYFTRGNPVKVKNLMARIVPVAVPVKVEPVPVPANEPGNFGGHPLSSPPTPAVPVKPEPETFKPAKPLKPGFFLGNL